VRATGTAYTTLLASALLAAAPLASGATEEFVLVQRTVDTRYEEAPQAYEALLQSSLRRLHTVKRNETLQSITTALYSIGPKASPTSYKALEATIVDRNKLEDPNKLRAGQRLILPDLAPRKTFEEVAGNPMYAQPKVSASPSLTDVTSGKLFDYAEGAFTALPAVTDPKRKAAAFVTQWRWIPASQAEKELASATGGGFKRQVQAGRVAVQFAASPQPAAPPEEIAPDVAFVKALLARRQPSHDSIVYVLDDSWPSQEAFRAARDFFVAGEKVLGDYFTLGTPQWPKAILAPNAQTSFPFTMRGATAHAGRVDTALAPLVQLTAHVKVIYVPLFSEQAWSKEFLHELMRLAFTARGKGEGLEDGALPAPDVLATAGKLAGDITPHLPSQLVNDVAYTDQAVIGSLLLFAQLYARATGVPYFVSLSWTVPKYRFAIAPEPDTFGVPLAAVGNSGGFDVMQNKVQLAMRAREYPGDVLAIMNAHFDGTVACSSQWVVPAAEAVYGFVYDGFLAGGGCGTSFSTPRVAWYLALRQAFEPKLAASDQGSWFIGYRKFLLQLQDPAAPAYRRFWLSPQRLFSGI
jgi:hypothetical protein